MRQSKRSVKNVLIFLLAFGVCFSTVACGNNKEVGTASSDSKNVLKIQIDNEVSTLDSQLAIDGTSFEIIANFTDGLYQMDADGNPIPALAASEEMSEDGLTYTFTIREDANWSNGDPVTANDFVFAWQRAVDPKVAAEYAYIVSEIARVKNASAICAGEMDKTELGITALDDKTLKVELESPVPYFKSLLYFPTFYPVNQAFYESCGDKYGTSMDTVLANGAFKLSSFEPAATTFTFVKNESYYDADNISLDGLSYQVIKESQQALLCYQNGEIDVIKLSGSQVEQVQNDPEFSTHKMGYIVFLCPNLQNVPALANLNLRKALNCCLDREAIVKNVLKDGSDAVTYLVPDQLMYGPDGKDFRETAKEFEGTDKILAKQYYEEACRELGQDAFQFELLVDDDEMSQNIAAFIQEDIQSTLPGITIQLKVETKKQRVADMLAGNHELVFTRWGGDYADPTSYLTIMSTNSTYNMSRWSNTEYDSIFDDCVSGELALKPEERWEALHKAEKIMMDDVAIFPLYVQSNAIMTKSNVTGIEYHAIAIERVYKNAVKTGGVSQ